MSRRSKKKLTNRTKLIITVVIIAICLFIIHRFNFSTKSEVTETTPVKFVEYGTENLKNESLEIFKDENGLTYVVLPEKVNGFFVEKYFATQEKSILNQENLNTNQAAEISQNDGTNVINENTIIEESNIDTANTVTNKVIENTINTEKITDNIVNKTEENTVTENITTDNNEVNNKENVNEENKNTTEENIVENKKITEASENVEKENLEKEVVKEEKITENETETLDKNEKTENEPSTNTLIENTVTEEVKKENTNSVENTIIENQDTKDEEENTNNNDNAKNEETNNSEIKNEDINAEQNEQNKDDSVKNENNEEDNTDNEKIQEPVENNNDNNTEDNMQEIIPGERFYVSEENLQNGTTTIEVKYYTLEINGLKLYKQELLSDLVESQIAVTGYMPEGYSLNVNSADIENIKEAISDVKEFEDANILLGYDIKIVNGENEFQPKEYHQIVTVNITSNTYLEGKLTGSTVGAVHVEETDEQINLEKISIADKTSNSVEVLTDEFSVYAILEYPAIQPDSVTIYDYDYDKNYYIGKDYTDGMTGNNPKKYTEDKLAKVNINYYSYNYSKNLNVEDDLVITNYTWKNNSNQNSGTYRNYTVSLTVTTEGNKCIDPNKRWQMTFDLPNSKFSAAQTKTLNGNKVSNISADNSTITVTGNDFSEWTQNSVNSYTTQLIFSFSENTTVNLDTVNNFKFTAIENKLVGYVSAVADNTSTEENEAERQMLFTYVKCLPIDDTGNISFELIDNPYMDRPVGFGFNGWITNETGYNFSINADTKVQTLTTNLNGAKEITINLYVDWKEANIVFVDSARGNNNNNGKFDTPVKDWAGITNRFKENTKTATNASNRELNIIVLKNGTLTNLSNNPKTPYTLTSLYNGVDYRNNNTYLSLNANFVADNDLQLEFLNIKGSNSYTSTTTTSTINYYIIGNGRNIRLGRGLMPLTVTNATTTFAQVQGGLRTNTQRSYKLVIESGRYTNIHAGKTAEGNTSSYTYTSSATMVLGCDYDRIRNDNSNLSVYNRTASRSAAGTITSKDSGKPAFEIVVKSGTFGMDYFNGRTGDFAFAGIYLGGHSSGTDNSDRVMIVEGGNIANLLGGLAIQSDTSTVKTYIYVKGGNIQNIVGGAGVSTTRGDRIIQVTDGKVAYSVSGGSNGYTAGRTQGSSNPTGQLIGNTIVYIGGNAVIGTVDPSSTLYEVNAGSVLGAGNGNDTLPETAGKVNSTHVIIDGNAKILGNVYGGGNYGTVGNEKLGNSAVPKVTFTNSTADFKEKTSYIISTGANSGNTFTNANGTTISNKALSNLNIPDLSQQWIFENAGEENKYYIKNAQTGNYLNMTFSGAITVRRTISLNATSKTVFTLKNNGNNVNISYTGTHNGREQTGYLVYSSGWTASAYASNLYLLTYTKIKAEETSDLANVVTLDILGGTVQQGVYGGANNNDINGSVKINMKSGIINESLYGGSNSNGTILGASKIDITGGTIGTEGASTEVLFGGGRGQPTSIGQRTVLNILDQDNNIKLYGNIYGGSALGDVSGTATVNISDTKSTSNTIFINGNIYGGGKGQLVNEAGNSQKIAATNGNDIHVIVDGGTYGSTKVFGGCNENGNITGNILVEVGKNAVTNIEEVYGGGNKANISAATTQVDVYLYKNAKVTSAFNGGNSAGIERDIAATPRKIVVDGGNVENLYGGSNEEGNLTDTYVSCINGALIGNVYGGGFGEKTNITADTYVNIDNSTVNGIVYGGGCEGKVLGTTTVEMNSANILDTIYGGGKKADVGTTDVSLVNTTVKNNIYGGGEDGQVTGIANATNSVKVYLETTKAINVFGGGKGETATVTGNSSITLDSTNITGISEDQGNVYGGGDLGLVTGSVLINILNSTNITNCVYGGGNRADIVGNTSVAIEESTIGSVYGGGNAGSINSKGRVGIDTESTTSVSILGSEIKDTVFGGGNKGEVTGNTYVLISDFEKQDGTIQKTTIANSLFGGGKAANVNGTTINILNGSEIKNVYGGGDLGEVSASTNITIDNSIIKNNVYAGGNGTAASTAGHPGQIIENTILNIKNASIIGNNVFGGGQGITAIVNGNTNISLENSEVKNDIYGGGDNGSVNGSTKVAISSSNINGNAYAAGNGESALVKQNSYISAEGNTQIGKSIFGGGNAAETGDGTSSTLAIVDIAGAVIGENVYGGANSSVINGNTITNIGTKAINDYYGEDKQFKIGKIDISGTVFGGGEQMDPTKEFNYDTISVTGTILINVDGEGYETSESDTNTINISESIFGSGNASSANTNGNINIRNYGKRENPKRGISIQRATTVVIDNSSLLLNGTTDSTSLHPEGLFSLNRISELKSKNNTTLYLVSGANLLGSYYSLVGEDGNEEYATVDIIDKVSGEDGKTYEVINGNIYNKNGDKEYFVREGVIYKPANNLSDPAKVVTKIANIDYASTINANVDNRIYMYSGRNLNISNDEEVSSKYGEVKGMTFYGIFKNSSSDSENGNDTNNSNVYMGMYSPNYTTGGNVSWGERDFNRSYILGLHTKSPEQDISKDGFYTVHEKLNIELADDEILTEENYDGTCYIGYITPTPEDDLYYMWYTGPDDEIYYYSFNLTASKHSTFGTKELALLGISYENAVLTMSGVDASLQNGVGLYDKNTIPNINPDQNAANNNFALTMKTGNTGWSMAGTTDFYGDSNNASFDGTNTFTIENLKTTPIFSFYLYHSNNLTESKELGTYQINMKLSYWKDALNRGNAKVIIDVMLMSEVFNDVGYNGAIAPGSQYDLFANTVTNVSTESSFSTYFELAQPGFMQIENVAKYYENSYRIISTEYAFPEGTTITMIDRWNRNNPSYYYYTVTQEDANAKKNEYKFSEFKVMGSLNEFYNEKEARKNYYINDNNIDYQYENFIFIVNFENAKFNNVNEELIVENQHFRIYLKSDDEQTGRTEILFGLLDDQIDKITYGIYNNKAEIKVEAKLSKNKVYLGNEIHMDVDTIYDVKKGEQAVTIYDTKYFDKKLGIKLTFYKKNNSGQYEIVNGANLLGTYFELNGKRYYPKSDGTTRIKIAELVSNAASSISIGTEHSSLPTGEYRIIIESFGSADGIYYGVETSSQAVVELEIINDVFGLNAILPDEQTIVDKVHGYTLDKDTGLTSKKGNNKLNFKLEYLSGLNDPYITVALYRRMYDETMIDPYDMEYELVDLKDYVKEDLTNPKEINQEYEKDDEEFVQSIKKFNKEYLVLDKETIKSAVVDNTVSITLNANYTLKENLKSGTYKVVFRLYDANNDIVNKKEPNEIGDLIDKPFNVIQYELIGDSFSYLIIK